MHNITVNFSVDGTYVGNNTIPILTPGDFDLCTINYTFISEGTYAIKATIVEPELNEFFDYNNELDSTITVIDPVRLISQPDFGTGTDAFVSYGDADLTFGEEPNLKIGRAGWSGGVGSGRDVSRAYIKFDTTGIPANALVLDAELQMYMYKSYGGNQEIEVYQVDTPW